VARTYDPSTDTPVNRIRDLIGDVDITNTDVLEGLQDEEITWAYEDAGNNIGLGAARAARKLAARFAQLNDVRAGDYEERFSQRAKQLLDIAKKLETKEGSLAVAPTAGMVEQAELETAQEDTTLVSATFANDQFDNYRAVKPGDVTQKQTVSEE
jgi:hypothetical protein